MKARLIATGERAPAWVAQGFAEYQKRLSHWLPLELVEIEPGLRGKGRDPRRAIEDEGKRVLAALPKNPYVVALDVPGRQLSSEQLAQRLADAGQGPGLPDRRARRTRGRGIGGGRREVVDRPADLAAHAGAAGRGRTAVSRSGNVGQSPLPSRVINV